ncbi:hypothetical protein F5X68DRAFT_168527 [Plectosphaerella plurivora]|uniref:chitinase n=1 Tax=Plectosphaerella plurivora TaxID=936078 RepID=A0A9P8VCP2_9PEZI|nr:hypothetical protein F5X68DRAFT_168527 [Plectosphaerella plurivora]
MWLAALAYATDTSPQSFFDSAGLPTCPASCIESGYDVGNWTRFHTPALALACTSKPKLLDFLIRQPLQSLDTPSVVRACSTFRGSGVFGELDKALTKLDVPNNGLSAMPVSLQLHYTLSGRDGVIGQKVTAVKEIQASLLHDQDAADVSTDATGSRAVISHYGNTVAGVFVGGAFSHEGLAALPIQQLLGHVRDRGMVRADTLAVQLCSDNRTADYTFGVIIDNTPGEALYRVQKAVRAWSDAKCAGGGTDNSGLDLLTFTNNKAFGPSTETTTTSSGTLARLVTRANCRTRQVISGDTCGSLATKCGISGTDINKFNTAQNFCSTLKVGQHICCSSGTLPDVRPKPQADGTCASYEVRSGDWCDKIASSNGLTVADVESFNKKTWGWSGCGLLYVGIRMCLSKGTPPFPAPIENAVCGPQKPYKTKPAPVADLATLNPCPLNACCNIWGQCGTTADFCTKSTSLGPPGTSEPGKSGCISNCGTGVTNIVKPRSFMKVGYFEGWNMERPCLHMDVSQIPASYTHIHFAFGDVLADFSVSVSRVKAQFDKFVRMRGAKRIIAFGGWTASTSPTTYNIYREGVKDANRERLATNLAKFVIDNGLDGLDIDWEYPGAPDIPGIPAGDPIDGPNYVKLLQLLRNKLPADKTLSIAAPASYWYLKQFPVGDIAKIVDYIIYMTYDLHGQWDYGNQWANPGCPSGNCLRSHVNFTESYNALAMVTKAGASTDKVIVGVTSYGRSFRMANPSCTGPMCRFTGPASGARPGRCTGTPGYLADAEIREILRVDPTARTFLDYNTMSNVLTYGSDWVAYMDGPNKAYRESFWRDFGFGGTTDWAIDLDAPLEPSTAPPSSPPPTTLPGIRFEEMTCSHELANDGNAAPQDRWKTLKAGNAWDWVFNQFDHDSESKAGKFGVYASNKFGGAENFNCHTLQVSTCTGGPPCDRHKNAGGYLILRSFAATLVAIYNAINDANGHVTNYMGAFATVFAPPKEEDKTLEFVFSFISLGIGLAAGPVFSKVFAASDFFKNHEKSAETLEGTVMGVVDFGIGQAKSALENNDSGLKLDAGSDLSTQLGHIVKSWKHLVTVMQASLFSGDKDTRGTLHSLINEGKFLSLELPDKQKLEARMAKIFYAGLIPFAWSLREHSPVLVWTGLPCDTVGSGDYTFVLPEDNDNSQVCIDGDQYFLLSVPWSTSARRCMGSTRPDAAGICEWNSFHLLPGIESMGTSWKEDDGDKKDQTGPDWGKWGGITRNDIAKSIIARHHQNGNRNLDKFPDGADGGIWDVVKDEALKDDEFAILPGLVNIPMCNADEAMNNWVKRGLQKGNLWLGFPCNRP